MRAVAVTVPSPQALSVWFMPAPLAAVVACCRDTGLVVDCGHTDTRAVAVFNGSAILVTHKVAGVGAVHIHRRMKAIVDGVLEEARGSALPAGAPWEYVEDVVVRGGFVAPLVGAGSAPLPSEDTAGAVTDAVESSDVTLPRRVWLSDASIVKLPGHCRWQPFEALFEGASCPARALRVCALVCVCACSYCFPSPPPQTAARTPLRTVCLTACWRAPWTCGDTWWTMLCCAGAL